MTGFSIVSRAGEWLWEKLFGGQKKPERKADHKRLKALAALVFWIAVWAAAAAAVHNDLLIPGPAKVLAHLVSLVKTGAFWAMTLTSLMRVLSGVLIGCFCGVLLAVLSAANSWVEAAVSPAIRIIRSAPVTSFIILVMLWTRYTFVPVCISALMVAPVLYENVLEGIRETDAGLLEVAAAYRFTRKKTLRAVYIPSVKPYFTSGFLTALGLGWKAGISAEVLCLPRNAIGAQMYYSKLYLETADLFAWTLVVVLFSYLFEKLFRYFVKERGAKTHADR